MSDPQYEYFYRSIDQEANRELVRRISEQVVEAIRPDEAIFTEHIFDELMELAAQRKVVPVGEDAAYSFGTGGSRSRLLLLAVLPLVANALASAFLEERVAGVGGMGAPPQPREYISQAAINAMLEQNKLRVKKKKELEALYDELNQQVFAGLKQMIAQTQLRPDASCCGYPYMQLRIFITSAFSIDELRTLCFDLREPHEDVLINAQTKSMNVVSMLEYFGRRGRLCELLDLAKKQRAELDWASLTPPTA